MNALVSAHSGLRWIVLILLIIAIFNAISSKSKGSYEKKDKMINLFAMIFFHTQFTIGIILLFLSGKVSYSEGWMKNPMYRFFGMEHILLMVIAFVLITMGKKKSDNAVEVAKKHSSILVFYSIALLIILAAIPWPFRNLGTGWF